MSLRTFLAVTFAVLLISATAYSEPVPDRLIGKVSILDSAKLDNKAKKELAVIAAKIKKNRQKGTIKITGDIPSADSQEEYIVRSAFMARNVEAQLRSLLPGRYQLFITVSRYSGEKRAGQNSVEIHLYPHELKVESGGFTSSQVKSEAVPNELEPVFELPALTESQQPVQSGLLSPPPADDDQVEVTSKKERVKIETENPALANELVIKAKARAAEKAKRLEQGK